MILATSETHIVSRGQQVTYNRLFLSSVHFYENLFKAELNPKAAKLDW